MKSRGLMLAAMALAVASETNPSPTKSRWKTREDNEDDEKLARERHKQIMLKRGVKEFTIDGHTVYARDYANALRKVTNLKRPKIE
jgi:hypothetical protein